MTTTLLDRHHALPGGDRVRLRLPHVGDRAAVHEFLERLGLTTGDLDVRRGLRWSPSARWSVVATRWDGARERIVGFANVDTSDGAPTLLAEDPGVVSLLARAIAEHAGVDVEQRVA
jgi:hypothetical protein